MFVYPLEQTRELDSNVEELQPKELANYKIPKTFLVRILKSR